MIIGSLKTTRNSSVILTVGMSTVSMVSAQPTSVLSKARQARCERRPALTSPCADC